MGQPFKREPKKLEIDPELVTDGYNKRIMTPLSQVQHCDLQGYYKQLQKIRLIGNNLKVFSVVEKKNSFYETQKSL